MRHMVKIKKWTEDEGEQIVYLNPESVVLVEPFHSTRTWSIRTRILFDGAGTQGFLFSTEGADEIQTMIKAAL